MQHHFYHCFPSGYDSHVCIYGFNIFYHTNFSSQNRLDSDDSGSNFSTTGAYPDVQEGETPTDKTVEYRVNTNDELNLKQFAEQSTSTAAPFECEFFTLVSCKCNMSNFANITSPICIYLCPLLILYTFIDGAHLSFTLQIGNNHSC
jgi:hypothetical protein